MNQSTPMENQDSQKVIDDGTRQLELINTSLKTYLDDNYVHLIQQMLVLQNLTQEVTDCLEHCHLAREHLTQVGKNLARLFELVVSCTRKSRIYEVQDLLLLLKVVMFQSRIARESYNAKDYSHALEECHMAEELIETLPNSLRCVVDIKHTLKQLRRNITMKSLFTLSKK